ncbi:hypothetical protein G6045_01020 [Streptomyces sp. YC504]|uniref:DUF485 domain-containing protein n=1 Tax=Streptomyces mesophilus TaxID=1775132 RepID=A0A6G4XAJ5_9ACTN|nr:hypothetical protein [Streptomyces mesophilus]NGO74273.1 hypothetical protein [Streptomyces mesophilus]
MPAAPDGPRRETVTGVPRQARRPLGHTAARSEIDEQTTIGTTYVRSLMRSQLKAGLTALGVLILFVGTLPLLFMLPESVTGSEVSPTLWVWLSLGVGVYPVMLLIAHWYVRRAERNERDFTGLVEGR